MRRQVLRSTVVTAVGAVALGLLTLRWSGLHWGATTGEVDEQLPGDEVVTEAGFATTRAITIGVPPERVWPWVVQLGQSRGGFYSYDWPPNLVGCDIHSVDEVVERWQHLAPGDTVWLHPKIALRVESINPGRSLVLRGPGGPGGGRPTARGADPSRADGVDAPADFSWSFVVRPYPGLTTRLLVRERYAEAAKWPSLAAEALLAVSSIMTRGMLLGIKKRAESVRPGNPLVVNAGAGVSPEQG
ncbi:MAG: SRPBCC family protein [Dermatophilaceae bacterium]